MWCYPILCLQEWIRVQRRQSEVFSWRGWITCRSSQAGMIQQVNSVGQPMLLSCFTRCRICYAQRRCSTELTLLIWPRDLLAGRSAWHNEGRHSVGGSNKWRPRQEPTLGVFFSKEALRNWIGCKATGSVRKSRAACKAPGTKFYWSKTRQARTSAARAEANREASVVSSYYQKPASGTPKASPPLSLTNDYI